MLKQLHAHKTENRLERGLIEGEENVRPILLSHFWSVTFTIILLLAIWLQCRLSTQWHFSYFELFCLIFCLVYLNRSCLLPLFRNCFSFTPSYASELFFSFKQQWLFLILCLVLCFSSSSINEKKGFISLFVPLRFVLIVLVNLVVITVSWVLRLAAYIVAFDNLVYTYFLTWRLEFSDPDSYSWNGLCHLLNNFYFSARKWSISFHN
jgi:hypothetical protein